MRPGKPFSRRRLLSQTGGIERRNGVRV